VDFACGRYRPSCGLTKSYREPAIDDTPGKENPIGMYENPVSGAIVRSSSAPQTASSSPVLFGAAGDLAHNQISPALPSMARRGSLNVPVTSVAKSGWKLDQPGVRPHDSLAHCGGGFPDSPGMARSAGPVSDSSEEPWTIAAAIHQPVSARVLDTTMSVRFRSCGKAFAYRVLSALRYPFGGHGETAAAKKGNA
jgi:hypothetical protein